MGHYTVGHEEVYYYVICRLGGLYREKTLPKVLRMYGLTNTGLQVQSQLVKMTFIVGFTYDECNKKPFISQSPD